MKASHVGKVLLALGLVACARSHENSALDIRDPWNAAMDYADGGYAHPSIGNSSLTTPGAADSEVWIGELWSIAYRAPRGRPTGAHEQSTVLCTPDAADPPDTPVVLNPRGSVERAVLTLEHVNEPELGGHIQLGEGEPPTSPGDAPFAINDGPSYWDCSNDRPTRGVAYALHDAKRYPDRLTFSIVPSEVWDPWCAMQTSPCGDRECGRTGEICACTNEGCRSTPPESSAWGQRILVNLAITARTIEGQFSIGDHWGWTADLRLERAR
jgi:hypothetical protein